MFRWREHMYTIMFKCILIKRIDYFSNKWKKTTSFNLLDYGFQLCWHWPLVIITFLFKSILISIFPWLNIFFAPKCIKRRFQWIHGLLKRWVSWLSLEQRRIHVLFLNICILYYWRRKNNRTKAKSEFREWLWNYTPTTIYSKPWIHI